MKNVKNQKGFTMVELILVMTILGILAVAALPSFIDVTTQANDSAASGTIGAVREAISLQSAALIAGGAVPNTAAANPPDLDSDDASPWFDLVMMNGVNDPNWAIVGNVATYTSADATTKVCTYVPATGAFAGATCQ